MTRCGSSTPAASWGTSSTCSSPRQASDDKEFADTVTKVKGKWAWSKPSGPAALMEKGTITAAPATATPAGAD